MGEVKSGEGNVRRLGWLYRKGKDGYMGVTFLLEICGVFDMSEIHERMNYAHPTCNIFHMTLV